MSDRCSINLNDDKFQEIEFNKFNKLYPETIGQVFEFSQNKHLKNLSNIIENKDSFSLNIKTLSIEDNKRLYYEVNAIKRMKNKFLERKKEYFENNKKNDLENYDKLTLGNNNKYDDINKLNYKKTLEVIAEFEKKNQIRKNNKNATKIVEKFINFNKKKNYKDNNSYKDSGSEEKQISDNEYIN